MVVTNNDITQKNYKKLSIQVALNGLSFCAVNLLNKNVVNLQKIAFDTEKVLEEQLWKVFSDYPILSEVYDEVVVLHQNTLNAFVPQALFDENFLGSYLQYNVKVFESDLFSFDELSSIETNNVYVPYVNINNFLLDQFQTFTYKHAATPLVQKLSELAVYNFEKQVFIHLQNNIFEIVVIHNGKLLFFNTFEATTKEDFIYYTLFTFEQLQLNPDKCNVQFLGVVDTENPYFKIAYQYIRNCKVYDTTSLSQYFNLTTQQVCEHFILLHA